MAFPYAQYGYGNAYLEQIVTNGRADYDALQMRMQRRMSNGLSYTVAYTWSKALGDFLDHLSAGGGAVGNSPSSAYAMEKDYGLLAFDIQHRLVTSFIYELPFGDGRTFQPAGALGAIARDWSVNGILTLSGGRPFTVTTTDQAQTGPGRLARANCVGDAGARRLRPDDRFDGWTRRRSRRRRVRTYGNCANNTVRGPGSKSMNLSVFRSIRLGAEQASRDSRRDVQPVQLGELRFPGGQHFEPGNLRTHYQQHRRPARGSVGGEVLFLTLKRLEDTEKVRRTRRVREPLLVA